MNNSIKFLVKKKDDVKRLDVFLSTKIDYLTRSNIKKIIESGNVTVNKKIVNSSSKKVKFNDSILIKIVNQTSSNLVASKMQLDIRYEDNDILIVNKPKGMVVHPGS